MKLDVAYLTRPCRGQQENGDAVVVRQQDEVALLCVIDALGHGPAAAEAACTAVAYLQDVALGVELRSVVEELDRELRGTRGAAAMICRITGHGLEGCGVGNVELRAQGTKVPVVLSPGVLGMGVRRPRFFTANLVSRARLVLFSDGIASAASYVELRHLAPQEACDTLFHQHCREYDDATLLLADVDA